MMLMMMMMMLCMNRAGGRVHKDARENDDVDEDDAVYESGGWAGT